MLNAGGQTKFLFPFLCLWCALFYFAPLPFIELLEYSAFLFLGILGAIFANSTGSGGGVVFIPLFNQLNFTELQSIATSFAIQCFGMTAGAVVWYRYYLHEKLTQKRMQETSLADWQGFKRIIALCSICSIIGLWTVYGANLSAPASLHFSFSWFSLLLGIGIIASIYVTKTQDTTQQLSLFDGITLALIGLFGGAITAWLSVGVGELIAIYLIVRRFNITMAVSVAVIVSAITVWAGIWQHLIIDFQIYWQVVLFAGPGAILGGILAKRLVMYLSVIRLKLFFAFWLLVIGIVGIL